MSEANGKPTVILEGQAFDFPDLLPAIDEVLLNATIKRTTYAQDCYDLNASIELESGHVLSVKILSLKQEQPAA